MKTALVNFAKRRTQDAALGLIAAGASALVAEGLRRTVPEVQIEGGATMTFLCRLLADKPGAPRMPLDSDGENKQWVFGYGHLIFKHGPHWFYVVRNRPANGRGSESLGAPMSTNGPSPERTYHTNGNLHLRALTGGEASLRSLLQEARDRYIPAKEVAIYTWEGNWSYLENKPPRPLATVVVEGNIAEEVLADIKGFQNDEQWFKAHHIPYRRGYLFHGPPGSGKSTLAGAVAAEAGLNVCVMSLADKDLTDVGFMHALRRMPQGSVLLLEDIDAVNAQTERRVPARSELQHFEPHEIEVMSLAEYSEVFNAMDMEATFSGGIQATTHIPAGRLTLAGVLNGLDSLTTPSGFLVFMTTNHIEKLDPALIRPGRVDRHIKIGLATRTQARDLYRSFFPEESFAFEWDEEFADTVPAGTLSPAAIQEHLVRHRHQPEEAKRGIKEFA